MMRVYIKYEGIAEVDRGLYLSNESGGATTIQSIHGINHQPFYLLQVSVRGFVILPYRVLIGNTIRQFTTQLPQ